TIPMGLFLLYNVIAGLVPAFNQPDSLYQLANATMTVFGFLSIPLALGIAILHSHLWDIDVIIRRTLIYSGLSGTLALLYVGLVSALQFLLRGLTHQDPSIPLVPPTLVIVAPSQPLRHGLQQFIARRFYRRKYDAARIVSAFSSTLRNEVDLDTLSE